MREKKKHKDGNEGAARFPDDLFSLRLRPLVLLFRWGRAHVLQLHLFVRRVVLLGVVLRVWRRILRIQRSGHRERRRVVRSGCLHLHSGDLAITTTHHRGFLLPSQWTLTGSAKAIWAGSLSPREYYKRQTGAFLLSRDPKETRSLLNAESALDYHTAAILANASTSS